MISPLQQSNEQRFQTTAPAWDFRILGGLKTLVERQSLFLHVYSYWSSFMKNNSTDSKKLHPNTFFEREEGMYFDVVSSHESVLRWWGKTAIIDAAVAPFSILFSE